MTSKTKVFLAYDERMALHRPRILTEDTESPDFVHERPSRLLAVYRTLMALEGRLVAEEQSRQDEWQHVQSILDDDRSATLESSIWNEDLGGQRQLDNTIMRRRQQQQRFVPLPILLASRDTICRVHSTEHYDFMKSTARMSKSALDKLTEESEDLYYSRDTFGAALLAAGGCIAAVDAVTAPFGVARRAMALVRPPAHHATRDSAMGKYGLLSYQS